MYDNKIRLSPDVMEKANLIAQEWGLKNARAAVEAVFRRYSDEYLNGRMGADYSANSSNGNGHAPIAPPPRRTTKSSNAHSGCEALDELDDLLGL
jgi:hypothetical protein